MVPLRERFEQNQPVVQCSMRDGAGPDDESFTGAIAFPPAAVRPGFGPRRPNAALALWKESRMTEAIIAGAVARLAKPDTLPKRSQFSSGPCAKPPGWSAQALDTSALGRSHRGALGKAKLADAIARTHKLLGLPADYRLGIVPASDTGAMEMAIWSLLGSRPVTMLAWESFGAGWVTDVAKQLKLDA